MERVPFSEVREFLEQHGYALMGRMGDLRVFRRGNSILRVEVQDKKVKTVDFETIQAILEEQEGFGRFGRGR